MLKTRPSSVGKLGANAILGVSLAVCKAGAVHKVRKVMAHSTSSRVVF